MQTLRKKTSPCKYKNDPSRFLGEGMTFKAKLIGILEVSEARGDKMCQDALNDLKTAIRAAGEHKQRITISIAIDGLKLRDEKTADCLYHHPVHKISFIAQDMSDSRAFGYIFGSPDTGHRFFGIKTDKTASQVVISMRDLFQVVFELKKKEIEMAKSHSEQQQSKMGPGPYFETIYFPMRDENEHEKAKGKSYSHLIKTRVLTIKQDPGPSEYKRPSSEAIADLLDLELELNSIQQGISQMEKLTPSDPFGPLSKGERYIDPFDDSFSKIEKPQEDKSSEKTAKSHSSRVSEETPEHDRHSSSSLFGAMPSSSKTHFFSQFSPGIGKTKTDDSKWFDQETESLFNDTVSTNNAEPTSSPVALNTPAPEPDQAEGKKSPIKTDLFTELDPLGTGRVKPYIDKKDFFQDLKNPPKKVLKELIGDTTSNEVCNSFFPSNFKDEITASKSDSVSSYTMEQGFKDSSTKNIKIDPFCDSDPFEQTDPFQEENFTTSIEFPPVFGSKSSMDAIFDEKMSWSLDKTITKESKEENVKSSPTKISVFSSTPLRVTLPPEKSDGPHSISTITAKLKSNPNSPDDLKSGRRKCYQSLKQINVDGNEESPVREEPFVSMKVPMMSNLEKSYKENFSSVSISFKSKENEIFPDDASPELPSKIKTTLFSIKPPPLPPKKQNMPYIKPPPRPPSLENNRPYYEFEEKILGSCNSLGSKEELRCVKLKKQLFTGKDSPPICELKKQNSDTNFPVLPPPPQRKSSSSDGSRQGTTRRTKSPLEIPSSILNLKLNQLDNMGLENLAITLGIPSENIYSMTLQELTKMLSEKYLTSSKAHEDFGSESFEADFDSNFGKPDIDSNPPPSYDKYAVFKELIESESKSSEPSPTISEIVKKTEEDLKGQKIVTEGNEQEDKYAALRQLSMSATKSENFSEEDDDRIKKDVIGFNEPEEKILSAINNLDLVAGIPDSKPKLQMKSLEKKSESTECLDKTLMTHSPKQMTDLEELPASSKEGQLSESSQLFPLMDQFSEEKKPSSPRDSWATFEKSDFEGPVRKKSTDNFNDNENSPFSSDGKEEVREIPFRWHQNSFRKNTRKDVPWQDDDESWDDYSPKESYCSDESSHEERSPEVGRENRYGKPWKACGRPPRSERMWNDKSGQWSRRGKWQEETEDEFEETWKKQRDRTGSYDMDRKNNFWHKNYEDYNKRSDWCRSEPWDDNERRVYCYGSRRKKSESDNEYRKRCDSDTSDKECVWTFQKGYSDGYGRTGKSKQYHGISSHTFRDCPEYFHEPRSKHRKNTFQKRPSSASESKRNYEKMFPPEDYPCRGSDKTYPGKRESEKDEYSRYQYESRHRGGAEFPHYFSSYDRKMASHHSKMGSRSSRGSGPTQSEMFSSPNKRGEGIEGKSREFGYFDSFEGKNYKSSKLENRFTFDSEAEMIETPKKVITEQSPREFPKSPDRRINQWASTNGKPNGDGFYSSTNSDNFANFEEDFKSLPKNLKPETSNVEFGKTQAKSKNLAMFSRQESTATLRKSDSINIFSRDKDPFEGDDFFSNES